jgi:hypothetical protein
MGKGRVITAHGQGRYTIEILEDRARAESARSVAVQRIADLDERITSLAQEIDAAQQAVGTAADEQDAAIAQYRQEMIDTGSSDVDLNAHAQAVQEAAAKRDALRAQQRQLKTSRLELQARVKRIDALPPLRQIEAWCADFTEDLTGEVATAEVPGEIGKVIIKPGHSDGAAWSGSTDGAIQPTLSGTPASVFYNLALLPGWQKWRPTFRIATVSNISSDLCDITLDPATNSQQGLNVNAQSLYSGVPIMYMDCNGDAFEEGDKALVAFSGNTDQPMVVGFEKEPKECGFDFFTRHEEWWPNFGADGIALSGPGYAHGLIFTVKRAFDVASVLHETPLSRSLSDGVAVCRLTEGYVVSEILFVGWREDGDDMWFSNHTLSTPITLNAGEVCAVVGITSNSISSHNYEFIDFDYAAFAESVSRHIEVTIPSGSLGGFFILFPFFSGDYQERRQKVLEYLPGEAFVEMDAQSPAAMLGLGLNAGRFG